MNRILTVCLAIACVLYLGCASGGGTQESSGDSSWEVTDNRGFSKKLTPAEVEYQSAQQFLSVGNYNEAINHLRKATAIKPTFLDAWTALGNAFQKLKNFEEAAGAFEKALELEPDSQALLNSIGYCYLSLENYDEAEKYYNRLISKDTLNPEANAKLGFIYQSRGDLNNAIFYYERSIVNNEYDAVAMGTLAGLYKKKNDTENQIKYLNMAMEADPHNFRFKTMLGSVYLKEKDYESAVPVFEALVAEYPEEGAYYKNLGFALSQTERKAEAAGNLEKAIELKGDDPYLYAFLAKIYNENEKYNEALETAKSGLALGQGEEAFLNYQYGEALSKLGRYTEAITKFEKVLATKDLLWSEYAKKQIKRQEDLIKRAKAMEEQL